MSRCNLEANKSRSHHGVETERPSLVGLRLSLGLVLESFESIHIKIELVTHSLKPFLSVLSHVARSSAAQNNYRAPVMSHVPCSNAAQVNYSVLIFVIWSERHQHDAVYQGRQFKEC